jgi:hypothetical protein
LGVLQVNDLPVADTISRYTRILASVPVIAIHVNTKEKQGDIFHPLLLFFDTKAYPHHICRGMRSIISFPKS